MLTEEMKRAMGIGADTPAEKKVCGEGFTLFVADRKLCTGEVVKVLDVGGGRMVLFVQDCEVQQVIADGDEIAIGVMGRHKVADAPMFMAPGGNC